MLSFVLERDPRLRTMACGLVDRIQSISSFEHWAVDTTEHPFGEGAKVMGNTTRKNPPLAVHEVLPSYRLCSSSIDGPRLHRKGLSSLPKRSSPLAVANIYSLDTRLRR